MAVIKAILPQSSLFCAMQLGTANAIHGTCDNFITFMLRPLPLIEPRAQTKGRRYLLQRYEPPEPKEREARVIQLNRRPKKVCCGRVQKGRYDRKVVRVRDLSWGETRLSRDLQARRFLAEAPSDATRSLRSRLGSVIPRWPPSAQLNRGRPFSHVVQFKKPADSSHRSTRECSRSRRRRSCSG